MINVKNGEIYIDGEYFGIDRTEKAYFSLAGKKKAGEKIDEQFFADLDAAMSFFHGEGLPEKEKRTDHIHMKVLPSVKRIAEKNAAAEGRTLSNYIEKLIQDDEKRKAGK